MKQNKLKNNAQGLSNKNLIMILVIVIVMLSLINFSIIVFKVSELRKRVTGFASTDYGYVNLTIVTSLQINVTRGTISWGSGHVLTENGYNNATLQTYGDTNGLVVGGNWTNNTALAKAIIIQNIGNLNVSLKLQSDKNASGFIGGGTGTNPGPLYQWNISNNGTTTACGDWNETSAQNVFANVNITQALICKKFNWNAANPMMFINIKLLIPADANNTGTALGSTITITGDVAI